MLRITIESPYAGDISRNRDYIYRCMKDSIHRGEAPIASHAIYPLILDESLITERNLGIEIGFAWMSVAEAVAFYTDYGWSPGMKAAKKRAQKLGKFIVHRLIGKNPT